MTHTDYSSKDQDGTGRRQVDTLLERRHVDGCWTLVPAGVDTQAESRMHVHIGREVKVLSSGMGHLEWVMCMFATVLFSAFCLENKDVHRQRFSAISVIDCKSVFDFRDKTWCSDWNRQQALRHRHGRHSRMPETDGSHSSLGT